MPKVSILIPTYNQQENVLETLESILAQDYPNTEIIISDDASKDETPTVLAKFAKHHPNVKLILGKQNVGISQNLNRMISAATGDYICITGGDDIFRPNRVSAQVAALQARPQAGLCHSNMELFESATGKTLRLHHPLSANAAALENLENLVRANYVGGPAVMVRKGAIPAHGFDPAIPMMSDWIFAIETGLTGIVYVPDDLMRYRIIGTSISRNSKLMFEQSLQTLNLVRSRYPQFRKAAGQGLSRVYRAWAVAELARGEAASARKSAFSAVRHNPVDPTAWVALAFSIVYSLEALLYRRPRLIPFILRNRHA